MASERHLDDGSAGIGGNRLRDGLLQPEFRVPSGHTLSSAVTSRPDGAPRRGARFTTGLCSHLGRRALVRPSGQAPAMSMIASAKALGASWGRLWPMPPSINRCEYL